MPDWSAEFRFALRTLSRNKGLTVIAILTLALGLGANTAIFSTVYGLLWSANHYERSDEIIQIVQSNPKAGFNQSSVGPADIEDWRAGRSFAALAAFRSEFFGLSGAGEAQYVIGLRTSPEMFDVLAVYPVLGRAFTKEETNTGDQRVAVVSDSFWQRQLGGLPSAIGGSIRIDGAAHSVIGIMPPGFRFLDAPTEIIKPLSFTAAERERGMRFLKSLGRLKPGVSAAQAQSEVRAISERAGNENPKTMAGWYGRVIPFDDVITHPKARLSIMTLLYAVGFVLLIACANIANLLLAHGAARRRELAIRASIGATRKALVRLLLTESVILGVAGGLLGFAVAYWCMPILRSIAPQNMARIDQIKLHWVSLFYGFGLSMLTGIVFGIIPAWLLSSGDLNNALHSTSRGSTGSRHRALQSLVVSEVVLSILLLAGGGLMIRSLSLAVAADPGFNTKNLMTARLTLPEVRYPEPQKRADFLRVALDALRSDARVQSAAAVQTIPLGGSNSWIRTWIDGYKGEQPANGVLAGHLIVTPGYFKTLGIPMLAGRDFNERDVRESQPAGIINETFAKNFWPDDPRPLGRRYKPGGADSKDPWITVVGIARDVRHQEVLTPARPEQYRPHAQNSSSGMTLVARTIGAPESATGALRAAVSGVDPDQPLFSIESLETSLYNRNSGPRATTQVLGFLAALALVLAAVGIYGVIAYIAQQRTREIGVRLALGAARGDIFGLVIKGGLKLSLIGVVIGVPAAMGVTPLLHSIIQGVKPHDVTTFVAVTAVMIGVALLAGAVPAGRAMRVDPVNVLRQE